MKFSCLQENLSKGLQIISKAVPAKGALPILTNVLISTENGRIKLSATDLEMTIVTYIGGSVKEEGAVTIPAKLCKEFITNLQPGTIEATLENDTLIITAGKSKSKFNGSSAKDYPELPIFPEDKEYIKIDPKHFSASVATVAFASGTDSSRPIFTGVYATIKGNLLTLASTDGFRLSEKTFTVEGNGKEISAIIPAKNLIEISKIFSSSAEPIKFLLNEDANMAMFKSEDTFVATSLIDGKYLDYKRIIPAEHNVKAIFTAQEFLEAVKLTNIFAKEGENILKIRLDPEGIIKVTSLSEETGEHQSEIEAEVEGELLEIAFNAKYLMDFLGNVKTERICFMTNGNVAACVLKPEEQEDFIHIIMPLQI